MTPPVSPSPHLRVSPKIVKKHVTNDELEKGGMGGIEGFENTP
jgi:hypothetical protein